MSKRYTILVNGFPYSLALYAGGAKTSQGSWQTTFTDKQIEEVYKKYVSIEKTKATKRKNKEIK